METDILETKTPDSVVADMESRIARVIAQGISHELVMKLSDEHLDELGTMIDGGLSYTDLLDYLKSTNSFNDIIDTEIQKALAQQN